MTHDPEFPQIRNLDDDPASKLTERNQYAEEKSRGQIANQFRKLALHDEQFGIKNPNSIICSLFDQLIGGEPLQAGARWVVERTNSWHNRGFKKLAICTERTARVIDALISFANSIIILRRLIKEAWVSHRWDSRPKRKPK